MSYLLLLLGFLALVKGADLLVVGASSIARRLNVSDFAIGLTVVAFGTSTPELFVTLIAALGGNPGIAIGNVIGSNIANTLLILGVAAVIRPIAVSGGTVRREMPFGLLASCALLFVAGDALLEGAPRGGVGRADGLLLLSFFAIFLYYSVSTAQRVAGMEELVPQERGTAAALALVVAGLAGLALGGKWIVDGAVAIARTFGMSETLVGLTVVAIGTSLPELATSAVAARRGNADIALGNVLGSNIFNIYFVLGVTASVRPLPFLAENTMDLAAMIGANLLLFAALFIGRRMAIGRTEGGLLLAAYLGYLAAAIARVP
ncbi:MAG TPA: calcium/sodium antiporter [Candidatus Methanoperedens sp.]|nr:calcium/sodium antiporter [Candidatus Methanoperedens sp.]